MEETLRQARENTIQGLSLISQFWGFSKGMGAIYGAIYLSPDPLSLDELVEQIGITKGAVSTNVRHLERLGLVHKRIVIGERKDFYVAETDFWKILKGILQEREKSEFDRALRTVSESLELVGQASPLSPEDATLALFYQKRLHNLSDFFKNLDNLVGALLALENLRSGTQRTLFGKNNEG
jgi:DNA-binding transcriptional regulator GbsR (MarR family)